MAVVARVMVVTGNSQNPMNKKWKLAFTPLRGSRRLAFSAFSVSLSLVRVPRSKFVEGAVVIVVGGRQKEKSKGRKEFNIKKLSFCVDMKIPRISATFLRRLFSSLLPPHLLRVYRGSLRRLHLHLFSFFIFSSLQRQTLYRVLLLFGKTRRQQANKVKRY